MAQFEAVELPLPGAMLFTPVVREDERGSFTKSYHLPEWEAHGVHFSLREEFYSHSRRGVLRGMHMQVPPAAHRKVVTCLRGCILDVVLDTREDSPAFGCHHALKLDERARQILFLPAGIAHGFLTLEDDSLVVYKTDHEYAPDFDTGFRYDSFGFDWPISNPTVSPRDLALPLFRP